ncbi:hypothetical protein MNBD_GAMMA01-759 [hydrothermal vent metagenome]|uniref:DUF4836 family protein n=1 Tax=hydrothermal vent metagenome TaxID=652676 RepID=A0A3B0VMU5_9ZZZZ
MKQNKLIAITALAMSLTLTSCSDDEPKVPQTTDTVNNVVTSTQSASAIMSYIPADTPVLALFVKDPNNPIPQNFKDKMDKVYGSIAELFQMAIQEKLNETSDEAKKAEMSTFVDKWLTADNFDKLGLSMDESEFALYSVDLFPVLRMTLAKTHALDEFLDELMGKANTSKADSAIKKDVNGTTVYQFGDKEIQIMVSLNGNALAISLAPAREVDNLMPKLLGFEKPAKTIVQSNQYQDTISKYNYLPNNLYWFNIRQLADYFVNPDQYQTSMLDIMKIQDNMMSADCKTEILALFDKFPRLVGGTTIFNENTMDSHMIFEMEQGLGSKLATMTGRIPNANVDAAITYGFSFDIVAAKALAQEFVTNIETTPYKCEFMAGMNEKAATLKAQLDQPLPPFVSNFKGVNVVINELDLDMSKKDPNEMIKSLKAKVLLAVDNPEALQGMAEMMMPDLQKLGLKAGADAVNISSMIPFKGTQMPVNLDHVFLAMGTETIGVSLGEDTDVELTQAVSSNSTPQLLTFKITADIYRNIFTGLDEISSAMSDTSKPTINFQQFMMSDMLWWETETGNMNFTDRGLEIQMDIKY